MKKGIKLFSLLSTGALLASGLKETIAIGEGVTSLPTPSPSIEDSQQVIKNSEPYDLSGVSVVTVLREITTTGEETLGLPTPSPSIEDSIAFKVFGWIDDGRTFNLNENTSHLILSIDEIERSLIATRKAEKFTFFDKSTNKNVYVDSDVFYDIQTGERIYAISDDAQYEEPSEEYFKPGQIVEYVSHMRLKDYIGHYPNYEELKIRIEKAQTIEEVAEMMLMMGDDWYTRVEVEYIPSGKIPMDRAGELVVPINAMLLLVKIDDQVKLIFAEVYQNSKNKPMIKEMFTGIDFSDGEYKKINSLFAKAFGVKKLSNKNVTGMLLSQLGLCGLPGLSDFTQYVRETVVEVDGRRYYDISKLIKVYDMLPEEYKFDYTKLPEPASLQERRDIAYDMLEDEEPSRGYAIQRAPENFYKVTRMGKINAASLPARNLGSNKIYVTTRDRFLVYGLTPDGNVYLDELPIGRERTIRM